MRIMPVWYFIFGQGGRYIIRQMQVLIAVSGLVVSGHVAFCAKAFKDKAWTLLGIILTATTVYLVYSYRVMAPNGKGVYRLPHGN